VCDLQAAFEKAHKAALSLYDQPPKTVTYPAGGSGHQMATYELKARENGQLPVYQEQGGRVRDKLRFVSVLHFISIKVGQLPVYQEQGGRVRDKLRFVSVLHSKCTVGYRNQSEV